jgi:hypothetical protein
MNTIGWDKHPELHLGRIELSPALYKHKKAEPLMRLVFNKFDNHCIDEEGEKAGASDLFEACKSAIGAKKYGVSLWYLYKKDTTEMLCLGLIAKYQQLSHRYTPPKHRNKGYATELLCRIGYIYSKTNNSAFWVCSWKRMDTINRRAGFEPFSYPNRDGSQDYTLPGVLWDRYKILNDNLYTIGGKNYIKMELVNTKEDRVAISLWAGEDKALEQFAKMKLKD